MSRNAVPIPRVLLATEFISVPFTQDILQIKGSFGHGVMEDSRFVKRPFLHESSLYGKLGIEKLYVFLGLQRYALWGGESKDPNVGKLPSSFNDLLRIVFSQEGGDDAPELDQDYKLGDQFGNYDGGIRWTAESITAEVYWQNFFEDKDGLILKNYTDGLFGIALKLKHTQFVKSVLFEHIYSKDQSGPIGADGTRGGAGGQDNYYNHSVYVTGWSHFGRSVGTPFFTSSPSRANNKSFFENNRVVVYHLGLGGNLSPDLNYIFKISTSNNYGLYRERDQAIENNLEYKFLPPLRQTS